MLRAGIAVLPGGGNLRLVWQDFRQRLVQVVLKELRAVLHGVVDILLKEHGTGGVGGDDADDAVANAAVADGLLHLRGDVEKRGGAAVGFQLDFLLVDRHRNSSLSGQNVRIRLPLFVQTVYTPQFIMSNMDCFRFL